MSHGQVKLAAAELTAGKQGVVRIAAVGDLHCRENSAGLLSPLFNYANQRADILLLAGDLTDYGLPEEANTLVDELAEVQIPVVAVLGNHDYESNQADQVKAILSNAGVKVLDGDAVEINGIGIAGVKGFAGGFGRASLGPWGEEPIKHFVNVAIDEALKLETALSRLRTPVKIALLHYSPIKATVEGEPEEIFAFLGTSRLEDPLIHHPVDVVFHGHAHRGTPAGETANGIPVYNVAKPLLESQHKDKPALHFIEFGKNKVMARESGTLK
ncbi:3',5'-cyclic adenosine monophosphate phosphodiesterase CpdA [Thalassocella blandensis]|nr:3',5'-cyclic adenosine monophosphate phosphodiesterase CpdA [Thalassocella blandensis]